MFRRLCRHTDNKCLEASNMWMQISHEFNNKLIIRDCCSSVTLPQNCFVADKPESICRCTLVDILLSVSFASCILYTRCLFITGLSPIAYWHNLAFLRVSFISKSTWQAWLRIDFYKTTSEHVFIYDRVDRLNPFTEHFLPKKLF